MESEASEDPIQDRLDGAMPWVGWYIAGASAICMLAMAADASNGFRRKKLWFPCKWFSLNATLLTLLAVAMKLPVDLNTNMTKTPTDRFAKQFGIIFMSTAMANFMPSLGSMTDNELRANTVALVLLVLTITGNVCIQLFRLRLLDTVPNIFLSVPTILMLLLLAILVCTAIAIPTIKRGLELKYQEWHKVALREEEVLKRRDAFRIDNRREEMMKYWVMAQTSSPQFVMARSVVSTTSAVICLLAAFLLGAVNILLWIDGSPYEGKSPYGYTTKWILFVQSAGVAVGIISPTLRWFFVVSFKRSAVEWKSIRKGFKIEAYWAQTLVDWRDSFSALQMRDNKRRKYLHNIKWFALTFFIVVQISVVMVSKLLVFLSALILSPFFLCFTHIKKFVRRTRQEADGENLSRYVLLLEGEPELPRRVIKNMCGEADNIIKTGRREQPKNLLHLLKKFVNFHAVGEFDSNQIPSLHSEEPPNCWRLPVVTLTSIAIALPNIAKHKSQQLLSNVSEGLSLAKVVEKTLVKSAEFVNIRKAADVTWVGVFLYMKWLDIDIKRMPLKFENSKAVLQALSNEAEGIITKFKREEQHLAIEHPINWPAKVVAANSMYRICQTLLLSCEKGRHTDEGLFEQLSVMIAGILAACFTNLPQVITTMCHHNAIEKRDKSVRKAFLLLGKTEQVIEVVQRQEWPSLDHDKAADIDEWHALFQQDKDDSAASAATSSNETVISIPVLVR